MHTHTSTRRGLIVTIAICATGFATGSANAVQDVQLTTVKGDASIADTALTGRGQLSEDQQLSTGDDGNASVLLDRNAVVELCGQSRVQFTKNKDSGTRVVNIEAGEVKLIVEPRNASERIEIHTPAAIATILGTVVYVSVDPVTGATTISSSQSQVNIRSMDDQGADGTTISAYEQLTVVPGEQAQQKRKISEQQVAVMASCLLDFHEVAIEVDRLPMESKAVERVATADVGAADLPPIESGRAAGPEVMTPAEPEGEPTANLLEPTDTTTDPTGLLPPTQTFELRSEVD